MADKEVAPEARPYHGKLFAACVHRARGDGTYDVLYDDGDTEQHVLIQNIRKLEPEEMPSDAIDFPGFAASTPVSLHERTRRKKIKGRSFTSSRRARGRRSRLESREVVPMMEGDGADEATGRGQGAGLEEEAVHWAGGEAASTAVVSDDHALCGSATTSCISREPRQLQLATSTRRLLPSAQKLALIAQDLNLAAGDASGCPPGLLRSVSTLFAHCHPSGQSTRSTLDAALRECGLAAENSIDGDINAVFTFLRMDPSLVRQYHP
ncbi:MAG: hypothetical protein SGPRY_002037 [Prymnesium sp.]